MYNHPDQFVAAIESHHIVIHLRSSWRDAISDDPHISGLGFGFFLGAKSALNRSAADVAEELDLLLDILLIRGGVDHV